MGMTREEIKDELCRMLSDVVNGGYPKRNNTQRGRYREAVKETIKVLEQEPCDDCISRQTVFAIAGDSCLDLDSYEDTKEFCDIIKELPPVTPQLKPGHWITEIKSDLRGDMWPTNPRCSECGGEPYYNHTIYNYKFCPYCGAKMIDPQESEDKK